MIKRFFASKNKFIPILFITFFGLSLLLFFSTFYVDKEGNINIAGKLWSDFGSTFPIIRSFSKGYNFPPEYPIFSGRPIRYHFVFYALVGLFEKMGLRIDLALNGLSALSFAALLTIIYLFALKLFKKHSVAVVSIVLFLFNGTLGFLEFFKKNPLSWATPIEIFKNKNFTSFGPYDGKTVSAFWNLNIFTNQRHLALAYAFFIGILYFFYAVDKKPDKFSVNKALVLGLLIGFFPYIHMAVFGMLLVLLGIVFLVYPKIRLKIILTLVVAITVAFPQVVYMGKSEIETELLRPGYLVIPLTVGNFFSYWFYNLGLNLFLPILGFFLAKKSGRKVFLPFVALFVIGNIFNFSPDIATNHKFFNLYLIGAAIFSAYFLYILWSIKIIGKILVPICLLLLTLSGIIEFFPVINDGHLNVRDFKNNASADFIAKNTPKNSVFLNSKFLYDNANIAGRRIYMGWPYFSWGAGYDTTKREKTMKRMLNPSSKGEACLLLTQEGIEFIETQSPADLLDYEINYTFFEENFVKVFSNPSDNVNIYAVSGSCS